MERTTRRFSGSIQRHDAAVCSEIHRWWRTVKAKFDTNSKGVVKCELSGIRVNGNNRAESNALQRDEYEVQPQLVLFVVELIDFLVLVI